MEGKPGLQSPVSAHYPILSRSLPPLSAFVRLSPPLCQSGLCAPRTRRFRHHPWLRLCKSLRSLFIYSVQSSPGSAHVRPPRPLVPVRPEASSVAFYVHTPRAQKTSVLVFSAPCWSSLLLSPHPRSAPLLPPPDVSRGCFHLSFRRLSPRGTGSFGRGTILTCSAGVPPLFPPPVQYTGQGRPLREGRGPRRSQGSRTSLFLSSVSSDRLVLPTVAFSGPPLPYSWTQPSRRP